MLSLHRTFISASICASLDWMIFIGIMTDFNPQEIFLKEPFGTNDFFLVKSLEQMIEHARFLWNDLFHRNFGEFLT
jgi:hypothetical protein